MPRLLDPQSSFNVVLKSDEGKDPEPYFTFQALSVRTFNEVVEKYESIDELQTDMAQVNAIVDCLKVGMTGWGNMGREFDPDQLDDILTIAEAVELLEQMLSGQQVKGDEAKN